MAKSKLQGLKGDHLASVKELINGVEKHPTNLDLVDTLINSVADPREHVYEKIVAGQRVNFTKIQHMACAWDRLSQYSDWDAALDHLSDIVAGCGYTPAIALAVVISSVHYLS